MNDRMIKIPNGTAWAALASAVFSSGQAGRPGGTRLGDLQVAEALQPVRARAFGVATFPLKSSVQLLR
jgi:hypothetical protein